MTLLDGCGIILLLNSDSIDMATSQEDRAAYDQDRRSDWHWTPRARVLGAFGAILAGVALVALPKTSGSTSAEPPPAIACEFSEGTHPAEVLTGYGDALVGNSKEEIRGIKGIGWGSPCFDDAMIHVAQLNGYGNELPDVAPRTTLIVPDSVKEVPPTPQS